MSTVTLRAANEESLPKLLDVAVAEADPDEVMPHVPGPRGWTDERRDAFGEFHRTHAGTSFMIMIDGEIAGVARLTPAEAPGASEAGIWLARSVRGKGYGTEALHLLVEEARSRGTTALVAETSVSNEAAVGALRALGAKLWEDRETGAIHATLRVVGS